mgnify:FL=1|jgi:hypothetical protein
MIEWVIPSSLLMLVLGLSIKNTRDIGKLCGLVEKKD